MEEIEINEESRTNVIAEQLGHCQPIYGGKVLETGVDFLYSLATKANRRDLTLWFSHFGFS